MDFVSGAKGPVVIGHSWVTRLKVSGLLPSYFSFIDLPGGTFDRLATIIERFPTHQETDYVFLILGGNDVDDTWDLSEIDELYTKCENLVLLLRAVFPYAKLIIAQVEDRYKSRSLVGRRRVLALDLDFKRKGNKYNKWLNKFSNKEGIFALKGRNFFSPSCWYEQDGVHLNHAGMVKLSTMLSGYYANKLAG